MASLRDYVRKKTPHVTVKFAKLRISLVPVWKARIIRCKSLWNRKHSGLRRVSLLYDSAYKLLASNHWVKLAQRFQWEVPQILPTVISALNHALATAQQWGTWSWPPGRWNIWQDLGPKFSHLLLAQRRRAEPFKNLGMILFCCCSSCQHVPTFESPTISLSVFALTLKSSLAIRDAIAWYCCWWLAHACSRAPKRQAEPLSPPRRLRPAFVSARDQSQKRDQAMPQGRKSYELRAKSGPWQPKTWNLVLLVAGCSACFLLLLACRATWLQWNIATMFACPGAGALPDQGREKPRFGKLKLIYIARGLATHAWRTSTICTGLKAPTDTQGERL